MSPRADSDAAWPSGDGNGGDADESAASRQPFSAADDDQWDGSADETSEGAANADEERLRDGDRSNEEEGPAGSGDEHDASDDSDADEDEEGEEECRGGAAWANGCHSPSVSPVRSSNGSLAAAETGAAASTSPSVVNGDKASKPPRNISPEKVSLWEDDDDGNSVEEDDEGSVEDVRFPTTNGFHSDEMEGKDRRENNGDEIRETPRTASVCEDDEGNFDDVRFAATNAFHSDEKDGDEKREEGDEIRSRSAEEKETSRAAFGTNGFHSDKKDGHDKREEGYEIRSRTAEEKETSRAASGPEDYKTLDEEESEGGNVGLKREIPAAAPESSSRAVEAGKEDRADRPRSLGPAGPSLPARPTRHEFQSRNSSAQPFEHHQQGASLLDRPDQVNRWQPPAEGDRTRDELQAIRIKFLRLASRLGQTASNSVVGQVLYRLTLAEQLRGAGRRPSGSEAAYAVAAAKEAAAGDEDLDFACTILVLGKTGVGKSATINSIFDEAKTGTDAFRPSTSKVQAFSGRVHGIQVRVIDTPGLLPSLADQRRNEKVMVSVRGFLKKQPPDIVLYLDRLDVQSRDYGDLPSLRTVTAAFGPALWFNAVVVLTHAATAPPDGADGRPLGYDSWVAERSLAVQQAIRQAAGDMRLLNPVAVAENHPACRVNRSGQRVLPNGQVWKPHLLLLCFASKILAEANSLLKLQDNTPGKHFGAPRSRNPPLPFLLSSLLQSRAQLRLPGAQFGDDDEDSDRGDGLDSSDSEDYDQLPPFRRLSKDEVAQLDEHTRGRYMDELAERERLFRKKMWREEVRRRRELRRRAAEGEDAAGAVVVEEEMEMDRVTAAASVPVAMPDMVLPPSFDSDNPSHRYRYLETASQWLVRPVAEAHGWDHDHGYDGMSAERMFVVGDSIPVSISGQVTKDKREASLSLECAASVKHGRGGGTLAGLDLQTVGRDVGYTLRSETRFGEFKGHKPTGGVAVTLLGNALSTGLKVEDRLTLGRRVKVVLNGGALTGGGDLTYGGSLEASMTSGDDPFGRTLATLGLSVMEWHGDMAVGGNLHSQFALGGTTTLVGRANLNNRGSGQISVKASSSEKLQMALIGLLPVLRSVYNHFFGA